MSAIINYSYIATPTSSRNYSSDTVISTDLMRFICLNECFYRSYGSISEKLSRTLLMLTEIECFLSFGNCLWEFWKRGWSHFLLSRGAENFICHPLHNRRPQSSQKEPRNLNWKVILLPSSNSEEPYILFSGLLYTGWAFSLKRSNWLWGQQAPLPKLVTRQTANS